MVDHKNVQSFSRLFNSATSSCFPLYDCRWYNISKPDCLDCYPIKEFFLKHQRIYHVHIDADVIMSQKEIFSDNKVFLTD